MENMYSGNVNGTPIEKLELNSNPSIEDTKKLAKSIEPGIKFEFSNNFLVKELPKIKVKKVFTVPTKSEDTAKEDANGIEAVDYETAEETKEVDSDYSTGVVLKIPAQYSGQIGHAEYGCTLLDIEVGDIIVYKSRQQYFDLFKDSKLVPYFDIIAVRK